MNREILFRAKKITDNQWVNGGIAIAPDETVIILTKEEQIVWNVIPETIGQFTGMKDKFNSGKNIFKGDIFKHGSKKNTYGVVIMHLGQWIVNFEEYSMPLYQYLMNDVKRETCGNIHDNPQLPVFF